MISLDLNLYKNYRPVSNTPYLSKVIEKIIIHRLLSHLSKNNLLEEYQSAYKAHHTTKTALLEVQNHLLSAVDKGQWAFLALLDLSPAFYTVLHDTLSDFMEKSLGICGIPLKWFSSYLSERTQKLSIGNTISQPRSLSFGVPQGSVLGLIIFYLYTLHFGQIMQSHGLMYHIYADDIQVHCPFNITDPGSTPSLKRAWTVHSRHPFLDVTKSA